MSNTENTENKKIKRNGFFNDVFKSIDGSFAAIADSKTHPQAVAPGFLMYTCWMIRHFDNNPWLRQNCNEDERYIWLHDAKFNPETNAFEKK